MTEPPIYMHDEQDPSKPSHWFQMGKEDAVTGGSPRIVDPLFQSYYDDGFQTGIYDTKTLDRETI